MDRGYAWLSYYRITIDSKYCLVPTSHHLVWFKRYGDSFHRDDWCDVDDDNQCFKRVSKCSDALSTRCANLRVYWFSLYTNGHYSSSDSTNHFRSADCMGLFMAGLDGRGITRSERWIGSLAGGWAIARPNGSCYFCHGHYRGEWDGYASCCVFTLRTECSNDTGACFQRKENGG